MLQKAYINLNLNPIAICQAHKINYFVSRFGGVWANQRYPGWVGAVFTLFYFSGGIFIFSPAKFISWRLSRNTIAAEYTASTAKGAQGTWCVTYSTWCTTVAVTCDEVGEVHSGGMKRLENYYI